MFHNLKKLKAYLYGTDIIIKVFVKINDKKYQTIILFLRLII